jgi:hypothetical protein
MLHIDTKITKETEARPPARMLLASVQVRFVIVHPSKSAQIHLKTPRAVVIVAKEVKGTCTAS